MFSENDKMYIIDALVTQLATEGSPRAAIAGPFGGTTLATDLTTEGSVLRIAMDAVRLCILDGFNNNPTWMERLLNIFQLTTLNAKVKEIWEYARIPPPPTANPYILTVLNNTIPFVNRTILRNHLDRLSQPMSNAQPILVVNGGDKSGKSYSTNYIDHFSNLKNTMLACSAKLDKEIGLDLTAEKLAKDLVSQMAMPTDDIPGPEENMRAYAETLAGWVLNKGSQIRDMNCWFVLDNFKKSPFLHPSTDYFITALSYKITQGMYTRKCRLILIGFDRAMLTVEPGKADEEVIRQCNRNDVETSVKEICQRAIQTIDVIAMTDFLVNGLPTNDTKMAVLNGRLRSLLQAVNRLNEILALHPELDYATFLQEMLKDLPDTEERKAELEEKLQDLHDSLS
ncbi:CheW domain-containing protein [Chitinophaga pinensis]|uniref:Uncharacterized protein n=1 Tax=Chitinophaga pinensis (strain ATCC 43595 / DSM 2588 / LMG 13176 / NBRC 15968 / NCIMB 11800 / UQM 2034) TaxID=485918 RepID=A0A979G5J2_CHIPD|nr:hypothetical protein [Chitinophaga pinensis]ACU61022.1 hypothetical protein Cpin_3558 [Chitinophaga pinensis DSM 2588]